MASPQKAVGDAMRKKQLILIIALIAVAVVLAVLCINWLKEDETGAADGLIVVNEVSASDVTGIDIDFGDSRAGLVKSAEGWVFANDAQGEIDQLMVETALSYIAYVYASDIVAGSVDDLAGFGLDAPRLAVTVNTAGGERYTYRFGGATSDKTAYYLMMEGDPRLYLFPAVNYDQVEAGVNAFRDLALDIDAANLTAVSFNRNDGTLVDMVWIPEAERAGNETWKLNEPFEGLGNPRIPELAASLLSPARLSGFVGDDVLDDYGLHNGKLLYLKDGGGNEVRMNVGAATDDGSYYCTVEGREGVYTVYPLFGELFTINTQNCVQQNVIPLDSGHVRSFALTIGGAALAFDAEAGTLNGTPVTDEAVDALFDAIAAVTVDGMTEQAAANRVGAMDIGGEMEISFAPYRNEFYAVGWYGEAAPAYVRQSKIDELVKLADTIE
jgi:hypothetical protein